MARAPNTEPTGSHCSACNGEVVKEVHNELSVPRSEVRFGPGGHGQFHEVTSYHCKQCGLMYKFPPRKRELLSAPVVRDPRPGEGVETRSPLTVGDQLDFSRLFGDPEGDRFIIPA